MRTPEDRSAPESAARPRASPPPASGLRVLVGFAIVLAGYGCVRLPTWLVERGVLSIHAAARRSATMMHVRSGCKASMSAFEDYRKSAALREVVIPVSLGLASPFDHEVCEMAVAGLEDHGVWWAGWVDRTVACTSLVREEIRFAQEAVVIAYPQFSTGDTVIDVFDDEGLADAGVKRSRIRGETRYSAQGM